MPFSFFSPNKYKAIVSYGKRSLLHLTNMKWLLILLLIIASASITYFYFNPITNRHITPHRPVVQKPPPTTNAEAAKLNGKIAAARRWCSTRKYSQALFCLIDLSLPGGRNRFFVYDASTGKIVLSGLVAHGNCNTQWLEQARFSNVVGCGCSSVGHYKIGGLYNGNYGKAFKLIGLDSSNANAYVRNVVLHSYKCVPEAECYPYPICNSQGCAMVAPAFMARLVPVLKAQKKPVLLWVYN